MDQNTPTEEWNALLSQICKEVVGSYKLSKEHKATSKDMLKNYLEIVKIAQPEVLSNEQSFSIMLNSNTQIRGFIDRIDRDPDREYNILDYKGLAIDTPIPTPSGWTTMEQLQVGDQVFGSNGQPTNVIVKSNTHNRPCYKITLSDHSTVVCDNVHLWKIKIQGKEESLIVETDELYRIFLDIVSGDIKKNVLIRNAEPPEVMKKSILGDIDNKLFYPYTPNRYIASMEQVDSVPTQCIAVDAPDQLYLCGKGMILTHNTGKSKYLDEFQLLVYGIYLLDAHPELEHFKGTYIVLSENKEIPYTFTRTDVERCKAEILDVAKQIREDKTWDPKPQFLCSYCDFEAICPATIAANEARTDGWVQHSKKEE